MDEPEVERTATTVTFNAPLSTNTSSVAAMMRRAADWLDALPPDECVEVATMYVIVDHGLRLEKLVLVLLP